MNDRADDDFEQPLLQVEGLTVDLMTQGDRLRAVDNVSFTIHGSETVALLGESGSGKTMTARALIGLVPEPAGRISSGSVLFEGTDLVQTSERRLRNIRGNRISMIFQDPLSSLNPAYTVGYQIAEMFRAHRGTSKREGRNRAIELMEMVQIPSARSRVDDFPHLFSGGMRQRVMIAMALALEPDLLIADEPTTALDVTVQAQIMELLSDLREERNMALLLISHDLGVVADAADQVAVMYAGRIVEHGPLEEVYRRTAHPYTRGLMASVPRLHGERVLTPISGLPPDMQRLPPGCAFEPRCPYAKERCVDDRPELRQRGVGHPSACHYAEEVRNDVGGY